MCTAFCSGVSLTCGDGSSESQTNTVLIHREDGYVVQRLRGQAFQQHTGLGTIQNHLNTKCRLQLLYYNNNFTIISHETVFQSHIETDDLYKDKKNGVEFKIQFL